MKILKKYLAIFKNAQFNIMIIGLLILQSCDISSSPEKLFSKANAERSQSNFKKAVKILSNLVNSDADEEILVRSNLLLAEIFYHDLKDFNQAIQEYDNFCKAFPDHRNAASSLFMQGFIYHNSLSDLQMAEKLYLKFLDDYPDHELALSVRWELDNLGKNIDEMPFFKN